VPLKKIGNMATKRARVNKTLEKAKKLISKKGNKKTKKGAWPEGQNRPQSKAYDIENDKTVPAKRTGYRFTKEGAKKLGKQPNDRPTAEEIDKYRNQTFKVKGKVNKSGPKGVGDGSFRYLYIESRADKSDLNKARKLELGGYNPDEMLELKIFVDVYEDDYEQGEGKNVNSYEVNWLKDPQVLAKDLVKYLSEELYLSENPNDYAIDDDGNIHTDQLQDDDGIHVNDKATLERWKKGEEKLYNAHYYIRPLAVKNRRPSVDELSKATGIGTYAKGGKIKVRYVEENEVHDWTLEDVLDVINRDRSENWTDYDKSDWQEGWDNWVEGEFYSLKDENGKPLNKFEDGGEMEKGGVVFDPKEVRDFQEHIFYYYGKNGALVSELEEGVPATTGEVLKAVSQYLAFLNKVNQNVNGFYGSMHRHIVHDIIEYNRNPKTNNYYYERVIDDMKKTPILEYGGILQPMIGGVNADPRFDIYNTTMFAEKGAEVPEGDEYAKGGKLSHTFKEAYDYGDREGYIRDFGSVELEVKGKDKEIKLVALAKIMNIYDATGDEQFEKTPYEVTFEIVPSLKDIDKKHIESAMDSSGIDELSSINYGDIFESYMSGVPLRVDGETFKLFATYDEAKDYIYSKEVNDDITVSSRLVGFALDRPVNRIGTTGWSYLTAILDKNHDPYKFAKGGDTNKQKVFSYFKSKEKNELDFWKDGGEYNISEMVDMASENFDIDEETLEKFAEQYANQHAKGGATDKGYSKKEAVIDYYLNNDIYDDPETYGVSEEDLKKNDFSKLEKAIIKYHGLNDPSNVEERFEVLGLDDEYAKGGIVKDIEAKKKALIKKAKARGIYENFGQKEVQELQDKYGHYSKEIAEFDNWAMNFDNDDLKKYKHGGSTHEQGYDDREDERLAMRHGKIASKDFVGSHKRREHSRRDDARFETRNK